MINTVILIMQLYIIAAAVKLDIYLFNYFEELGQEPIAEDINVIAIAPAPQEGDPITEALLKKMDILLQALDKEEPLHALVAS